MLLFHKDKVIDKTFIQHNGRMIVTYELKLDVDYTQTCKSFTFSTHYNIANLIINITIAITFIIMMVIIVSDNKLFLALLS